MGYKGRTSDPSTVQAYVDLMVKHGQSSIDTSRIYCEGTSEQLLGKLDLKGMRVDTKIFPITPGDHAQAKIKETFKLSLESLGSNKIRVFYLHAPDRTVPFEDTLEAVNELYQAGHFEEFGLSNYMSFEVAEIVGICKRRGFVPPTVYEGIYNVIDRSMEAELLPCLRKFGIKFTAYTVLAGGLLTGKLLSSDAKIEPGSHYDPSWTFSSFYTSRYPACTPAVQELKTVAEKHGLQLTEVAYRWLEHHSALLPTDHGIILGPSRIEQLETAIVSCEKGPLPQEVVDKCEETWQEVKGHSKLNQYWL